MSEYPVVYAAKHKNEEVRSTSTSGGMFTALSDYFLKSKGSVYGVKMNSNFDVIHSRATTAKQREEFKGSKYVQSDMRNAFLDVKKDLLDGLNVLFTGTPCQCAGLKRYLHVANVSTTNLVLCDIICYGVPSLLLFKEHLNALQTRYKSKVAKYYFRTKTNGWRGHIEQVVFENGKSDSTSVFSQENKRIFATNCALRPSCYKCPYTKLDRQSDITIADFWGIEKSMPQFDDNKGISLALLNTQKGETFFNLVKDALDFKISNVDDCLQPRLTSPTKLTQNREEFWNLYHSKGYVALTKKYANCDFKGRFKAIVRPILVKAKIKKN